MATIDVGDKHSILLEGLSGFWQRFFKDVKDLEAYYQAAEVYLGQVYLDLMSAIINIGQVDTPIFNKEYWKLLAIKETDLSYDEGAVEEQDRYVYFLPDDYVALTELQNTIFSPSIVLEKDLDFESVVDDGSVRFVMDPFRQVQNEDGSWSPIQGVAWRTIIQEVGNAFLDTYPSLDYYAEGVRRGDSLRVMAACTVKLREGTSGSVTVVGDIVTFAGVDVGDCSAGDVIEVYSHSGVPGSSDDQYVTKMVVKSADYVTSPNSAVVEGTVIGCPTVSSSVALQWRLWKADYYTDTYKDYEVDYIDTSTNSLVGRADTPYPTDLGMPIVYSIVRDPHDNEVRNLPVAYLVGVIPTPPPEFYLGATDINHGSVFVNARKASDVTAFVEEGVDYKIDYYKGTLTQLVAWHAVSPGLVDYTHKKRVIWSAGGNAVEQVEGTVKQLSFWVPTVQVDRFNHWYNFGSLLNRFGASSETYKAFLRGIMYLYATGPILERIESALNLSVNLAVVKSDGEVLQEYFDGVDATGVTASIDGTMNTVSLDPSEYQFVELDLGARLIIEDIGNPSNNGAFIINNIDFGNNVALVESEYSLVTSTGLPWTLSRRYKKVVTTDSRTYEFPFTTPMRADVEDPDSVGVLTFEAFEALTIAFTVTDYLEDSEWWHNKHIPGLLWTEVTAPETPVPLARRLAASKLYEHIVGAPDLPQVGDPGLYFGADEQGNVVAPEDGSGNLVPVHRHCAAFVLFDQHLKFHVFFVGIDGRLELDEQFRDDLEDLILVAKPSYTYPYVTPGERFQDSVVLFDEFFISNIGLHFGGDQDDRSDSMVIGSNKLVVGDTRFPVYAGDFFRRGLLSGVTVSGAPAVQIVAGTKVDLAPALPADSRFLTLNVEGTVNGEALLEGRDYVVNWRIMQEDTLPHPDAWELTALTDWDGTAFPTISFQYVTRVVGSYDTRVGDTPIFFGGDNPTYIRHTALDPASIAFWVEWAALRTEHLDRPIQLTVDDNGLSYTY